MESPNTAYLQRLDHVRAFAVVIVALFHLNLYSYSFAPTSILSRIPLIAQGHVGVALFMVISGFILAHIVGNENIDVWRFYRNRALRIYPLYWLVVTLGYFATPDPRAVSVGIDYLMSLLPIANLYRLNYGIFGGAFWSISIELQFYLLFPIIYFQIKAATVKYAAALIGLMIAFRVLVYLFTGAVHKFAYFSLFGCIDAFLVGIVVERLYRWMGDRRLSAWWFWVTLASFTVLLKLAFSIGGFFHVDYSNLANSSSSPMWILWPTIQAAACGALLLAYMKSNALATRTRFSTAAAWLGKISFSIYVWHMAVIEMFLRHFRPTTVGLYAVEVCSIVATVIAGSAISYYCIERPILRYRIRYIKTA